MICQKDIHDVKLKFEQVDLRPTKEGKKPSLEVARSNCKRASRCWKDPRIIDFGSYWPLLWKAKHMTVSSFSDTTEFTPKNVQLTLPLPCNAKVMSGTLYPSLVGKAVDALKHVSKGLTGATDLIPRAFAPDLKVLANAL